MVGYNCFIIFQYHYLNIKIWKFYENWKFYHFKFFFNILKFLKVLKFSEDFETLWNFLNFLQFWKIFKFWPFLYIATSTRLLRILTESNSTSNPVLVSGCVISGADYCASLRSRIPPVTLHWFPVASFPVQGILSISAMDLESKYCYFYHSWDFFPY